MSTPLPNRSGKPPRQRQVGPLVRMLLHGALLSGIVCVNETGEAPAQVTAPSLDPRPQERAAAELSADNGTVRIKNPFDRSEVFEFAPGTSDADARAAVAKLLMERARDRGPLLAEVPRRRGATGRNGTRE